MPKTPQRRSTSLSQRKEEKVPQKSRIFREGLMKRLNRFYYRTTIPQNSAGNLVGAAYGSFSSPSGLRKRKDNRLRFVKGLAQFREVNWIHS